MTMRIRPILGVAMALGLWIVGATGIGAEEFQQIEDIPAHISEAAPAPLDPRQTVGRALAFLETDAAQWREEHGCATCHHGTMTVWALSEAANQGYPVDAEGLAGEVRWTKEQFVSRFSQPRDPRPGWNLVSVPAIYLGVMSQGLSILSRDEINRVAMHLARHQEEDGTWLLPPPANGAPPIWESPETLALWAILAWEPHAPADSEDAAAARAGREKALSWLAETASSETAQAIALRLLLDVRTAKPVERIRPGIDRLLALQNSDGGWSQAQGASSDAFATGQTLWALSFAGVASDCAEIGRAVSFLVRTQREDGSWPMTSRNHPGVETTRDPIRDPVPITYFGSAWATLGLVRTVPAPPDTAARQQRAFDKVRSFHGKYDVDEASPDRPVVRVDLRFYEVSDQELSDFADVLQAFPRLESLQLKSTKITDAGLAHLKALPRLRSLALENAAISDAGLEHVAALTCLEELDLQGTRVTDAGVEGILRALPNLKVHR
jgi:hypothetical protein